METLLENFFTGYYQNCLNMKQQIHSKVPKENIGECSAIMFLCEATLNKNSVNTPSLTNSPHELVAAVNFLDFLNAKSTESKLTYFEELKDKAKYSSSMIDYMIAAACTLTEEDLEIIDSMKYTISGPIEILLVHLAQCLLIDRPDLIANVLQNMAHLNEDGALVKMASVFHYIASGNFQEALLTCCDIQLQCCATDEERDTSEIILNQKALSSICSQQYMDALEDLQKTYALNKNFPETIANLITCYYHMDKVIEAENSISELYEKFPQHDMVNTLKKLDIAFQQWNYTS